MYVSDEMVGWLSDMDIISFLMTALSYNPRNISRFNRISKSIQHESSVEDVDPPEASGFASSGRSARLAIGKEKQ